MAGGDAVRESVARGEWRRTENGLDSAAAASLPLRVREV